MKEIEIEPFVLRKDKNNYEILEGVYTKPEHDWDNELTIDYDIPIWSGSKTEFEDLKRFFNLYFLQSK